MPVGTFDKQPHEEYFIAVEFSGKLPSGTSLSSGSVYASRIEDVSSTTLSTAVSSGASSISLAADPGVGADIVIDSGSVQERAKAKAISGSGPYTVTLQRTLYYDHDSGATVTYLPGVNAEVLDQIAATVTGTQALRKVKRGRNGSVYKISFVMTLDSADILEDDVNMIVLEE